MCRKEPGLGKKREHCSSVAGWYSKDNLQELEEIRIVGSGSQRWIIAKWIKCLLCKYKNRIFDPHKSYDRYDSLPVTLVLQR